MKLCRRQFLTSLLAGLLMPARAFAFGVASRISVMELDLGAGTLSRPSAWSRLLYEVTQTTSVVCEPRSVRLTLDAPQLFEHPFAVLIGDGAFALPTQAQLSQLSRYLAYGGFLLIDDVSGERDSAFDHSVRRLLRALFPTRSLGVIPASHSIFRAFFLIDKPLGRLDLYDHLEGIIVGNLSPVLYSRNDLSGALERDALGQSRPIIGVLGGEAQRREAIKLSVNMVLYSITSNYKKDQAHEAELLRSGRVR